MTSNTSSLLSTIISSVSRQQTNAAGEEILVTDYEELKYRLMNVKSDNFCAFLYSAFETRDNISQMRYDFPSVTYDNIQNQINQIIKNYLTSVSGKSSEAGGMLLKMLLSDLQTNVHYFSELKNKSILSKIGGLAGNKQEESVVKRSPDREQ